MMVGIVTVMVITTKNGVIHNDSNKRVMIKMLMIVTTNVRPMTMIVLVTAIMIMLPLIQRMVMIIIITIVIIIFVTKLS